MEVNPNIEMGETQCNPTGENYNEVLFANIASGNPPDATIVWNSPVTYAVREALLPLDDLMAVSKNSQVENWPPGVLASCRYQGQIYGLPAAAAPYAMYYNTDLFEAAGISTSREDFPKTWDEMRRLSKEFTQWNGDLLEVAGFIPWGGVSDFYGMAVQFVIWAATNGGTVYDSENQQYSVDAEPNIEMMRYALEWWDEEYNGNLIQVNTSANWGAYPDNEGRPAAFPGGNYAMFSNGYWIATDMYDAAENVANWDVAPYPVGPSGTETASGYWPNWVVIPAGVPHPVESYTFLDYLVVEGMEVWYSIVPDLPANLKFPTDFVPGNLINAVGAEKAEDVNAFFRNQLNDAVPMWNSPVEDFYLDQMSRALEQIFAKTASPEEALGEVQRATQAELERVLSS
jgi:ABC-type glycerol-3-phosphate transport system substrate-binding protein